MISTHEYRLIVLGFIIVSILLISAIVVIVIYLVKKFKGDSLQKGFEEEKHLIPVPGYDD